MTRHAGPLGPRRTLLMLATCAFLLLVILGPMMSHIGSDPLSGAGSSDSLSGNGTAARQVGYIAVLVLVLFAVRSDGSKLAIVPASLLILLVWCWLSIAWAIEPGIALRRALLTTMVIWTIFLTVVHLGYDGTLGIVRATFAGMLVVNFAVALLWPSVGVHLDEFTDLSLVGDWRGFTQHKNFAGSLCAFTIIVFMLDGRQLSAAMRWGGVLGAGYFLYRSGSKTSMGVLPVALACGWMYQFYRPRYRVLLGSALTVGVVVVLLLLVQGYGEMLAAQLGDPDALTGRGTIWPVMMDYIADHWLLGSGYGSFWNIGPASPVFDYSSDWVSTLASGHNGYLDVVAEIGVPGLLLALWAAFLLPGLRLCSTSGIARSKGALLMALVVFCAGHNLTESSLLDRDMFVQVMLMYAIALIAPASVAPTPPLVFPEDARALA